MIKRERIEIIYDVLKAIQDKGGKAKPTHILYKSNLSSQMMKQYLMSLIEKGFIEEVRDKKNKYYVLNKKGFEYIKDFDMIRKFMDSYDLNES
ncbi:MAG: winged helix-turn-helix domain-containing protein [Candidatus Woesearchaeota archaeon]